MATTASPNPGWFLPRTLMGKSSGYSIRLGSSGMRGFSRVSQRAFHFLKQCIDPFEHRAGAALTNRLAVELADGEDLARGRRQPQLIGRAHFRFGHRTHFARDAP